MKKLCTQCHTEKPLTDFHPRTPKGHHSACKACYNTYYRDRYAKYEATGTAALKYRDQYTPNQAAADG